MYTLLTAVPEPRMLAFDSQLLMSWGMQFVNTVFLVFVLYKLLYKPVLTFLEKRTQRIASEIATAKELMAEAQSLKTKYETAIQAIEAERVNIINEATSLGKTQEAAIIAKAQEDARLLKEAAHKEITLSQEKAARDMRTQIIDISAMIATKYVEETISPAIQAKILDQAIEDLGDSTWLS